MMRTNTKRTTAMLALGAAALLGQGCILSIDGGDRPYRDGETTRLTSTERSDAVVVRSEAGIPSFSQAENARLAKLGPDITVEQFRDIFPEAIFRGSRSKGDVSIYEVRDRRVYRFQGSDYGFVHDEPVFFRFVDGRLEGWYHAEGEDFPSAWLDIDQVESTHRG